MSEPKPTEWDHLHSITMLQMEPGKWNLFASPIGGATIQFPAIRPDPAEAIIMLGQYLAGNLSDAAAEERERYDTDPRGAPHEDPLNDTSAPRNTPEEVRQAATAPTPSGAQRARPGRPQPRRRPKPRKR